MHGIITRFASEKNSRRSGMLDEFEKKGYIHLKQVIPQELLKEVRTRSINLKHKYKSLEGQPRHNGSGTFWKGLELASTLDPNLWKAYTSNFMLELAKKYLKKDKVYLFNDQVVIKLPNENFHFDPHFDNQFGPDPKGALKGVFKTINCCWILTNMPEETGPLSCLNKETNKYELLPAKAGDIVIIEGNTLHASTENKSDKIRALYACVYSTQGIGNFDKGYYNEEFKESSTYTT